MAYNMYLDGEKMPITPGSLRLSINNQNRTVSLINGSEYNVLRAAGLSEVSFDLLLPQGKYPFADPQAQRPQYYLAKLEKLKNSKTPFQWKLTRSQPDGTPTFSTSLSVSLESYEVTEDADEGLDIQVSVELKQYQQSGNREVIFVAPASEGEPAQAIVKEPPRDLSSFEEVKEVKTEEGDSLWNIAKKNLGDGSRYMEILAHNAGLNISNPAALIEGLILKIPGVSTSEAYQLIRQLPIYESAKAQMDPSSGEGTDNIK